ncbi:unnamed protein product [Penicillium pancosmium]
MVPVVEFIGFAGRASSGSQSAGCWTLTPYLIQSMFILLAPALFAASIYMILGRIILLVEGEALALIKRRWLTKLFVSGDVVCFLLLAGGGGIVATAKDDKTMADTGNNVIIAGLVIQLLWFALFVLVAALFHKRLASTPTPRSSLPNIRWQSYLSTLYVASTLIIIRSTFRVAEYVQGNDGYLLSNEVFLYIFDALPMLIVVVWLHWRHPGEIGLLLRDEKPDTNGLRLLRLRSTSKGSTV